MVKTVKTRQRLHTQAGLHLPATRIKRRLKKNLPNQRWQKKVHIMAVKFAEAIEARLLVAAANVQPGETRYIRPHHISSAL